MARCAIWSPARWAGSYGSERSSRPASRMRRSCEALLTAVNQAREAMLASTAHS
jgi:hypothetical protein